MTRLSLMVVAVLAGAILAATASSDARRLDREVLALLEDVRTEYGFPGATLAYVMPDGAIGTVAVGLADQEANLEMKTNHRMLAASVGKTVWGALVLALESDGVLGRSDPVADYLGHLSWFHRLPNARTMTIEQLLTHRSGLPDHVHMKGVAEALIKLGRFSAFAPEEAIAFVLDEPPLFEAGTGWSYSDTGYLVLGLVIETATERDVFELAAERFFDPLGLSCTTPSHQRELSRLAIGYTNEDNPLGLPGRTVDANGKLVWNPVIEWTGGGFVSTSEELAIWGHALFTGEAIDAPYLNRLLDGVPLHPDFSDVRYGSGVAIYSDTPLGPVYGHAGWVPGYVSSLRHYPKHGFTVAFQINTDVGFLDDSSDLMPTLETAVAGLLATHDPLH